MLFKLIVKSVPPKVGAVPQQVKDVSFIALLPPGFVGPAIGRAMGRAHELELLSTKKFSVVTEVRRKTGEDSTALGLEDIVPAGDYVTMPELIVTCEWGTEQDEVDAAVLKAKERFGRSTFKPTVACPFAEKTGQSTKPRPNPDVPLLPGDQPVEPPKRLKVYYTSALGEEYRGGDADFMKALVDGMSNINVEAVRIVNSSVPKGAQQLQRAGAGKLVTLDYYGALDEAQKELDAANIPAQTDAALTCLQTYLAEDKLANPEIIQVLNIQSRLPGSGSAFQDAASIQRFTNADVKVFITVHEWLFNKKHMHERFDGIQGPTTDICNAATGTIAVNDLDHQDMKATIGNATFVPIPITVAFEDIDVDAVLARPNRVLMFGMLRPGKGFSQSIDLGGALSDAFLNGYDSDVEPIDQAGTVWIVGKLTSIFVSGFKKIVLQVYKQEIFNKVFVQNGVDWWDTLPGQNLGGDALNTEITRKLQQCEVHRKTHYQAIADLPEDRAAYLEGLNNSLNAAKGAMGTCGGILRRDAGTPLEDIFDTPVLNVFNFKWTAMVENPDQRAALLNFDIAELGNFALLEQTDKDAYGVADVDGKLKLATRIKLEAARFSKDYLSAKIAYASTDAPLPVFFKLNLPEQELIDAFKRCKYVFKPDDKGMADNASAMISPMSNGCILFANWGNVTPAEFTGPEGARDGRLGVPPAERYKLDFAARYRDAVVLSDADGAQLTAQHVIDEIAAREQDGGVKNRATLTQLKHLAEHRYLPTMVAARNVIFFRRSIGLDPDDESIVIVPAEEHNADAVL